MNGDAEMGGLSSCGAKVFAPPMGAPHPTVGGARVERSCPWTRAVRSFASPMGRPDNGW